MTDLFNVRVVSNHITRVNAK